MTRQRSNQDQPHEPPTPSHRSTEEMLAAQSRRPELILDNIHDYAIFMLDSSGRVATWNEGAARVKGYAPEEIIGQHFSIFYTLEDQRRGQPLAEQRIAEAEGRCEREGFRVRKDGTRFWGNEIINAIRDDRGELLGFVKIARDLSDRKRTEDALRESEERYRLMVENIRDYAVFTTDPDGRVSSWNPGAERVFGYSDAEIMGRNGAILYTPEDRAEGVYEKELATALSEGRALDERWQLRKGGQRFWASGITTPLRDPSGGLRGFVKIARDQTQAKQVEEQRERVLAQEKIARLEAERAITMKDEFIAVVSHELRTPLTAILLWAKMLRAGTVKPGDHPRVLETIERSAVAQQQLIEDLLDVSRMMSGKLRLHVREIDAAPVVQAAVDAVRPMADAKRVAIEVALDERAGRVRADPDRLQQVVWNLLNNAVKFTPSGGRVNVTLRRLGGNVQVEVADTGKGIKPDFLPHVFERFRQAEASTTRTHGGLGLGLAICRQLVELHGGTIRAESAGEGAGATFTVELPLSDVRTEGAPPTTPALAEDAAPYVPAPMLKGLSVLLVEDDSSTRAALQRLLEQCAAEVTAVESAALAVAAFRDRLRERRFDVLVSDIGMPVQDGYELIREVRELERHAGAGDGDQVPAIALTAYAREHDRARAIAAGFQVHVPKPIEPHALVTAVAALVNRVE